MRLAQLMFDKKIATDRHMYKKRQEVVMKIAERKHYTNETFGQHMMSIDKNVFNHWYKIDRYFWEDEANLKRFMADNPETKRHRPGDWRPKFISVDGLKEKAPNYTINDKRCVKLGDGDTNKTV